MATREQLEQEIRAIRALDRLAAKHAQKVEAIVSKLSDDSRGRVLRFDASRDNRLPSSAGMRASEMRLTFGDDPPGAS